MAYDWDDPVKLASSLVAQLNERFPEVRESQADARMHPAARLEAARSNETAAGGFGGSASGLLKS